jgi:hypothetical protein
MNRPHTNGERIKFMVSEPVVDFEKIVGVENIYMARVDDMYNFIKYFYFNFDEIYTRHNTVGHQELPVFFERNNF